MERVKNLPFWQYVFGPKMEQEETHAMIDRKAELEELRLALLKLEGHLPDFSITIRFLEDIGNWAENTFGPGERLDSILEHLQEEIEEVRQDPKDLLEWADLFLLIFDGARRQGHSPVEILTAIHTKFAICVDRKWPPITDGKMKHIKE